MYFLEIEALTLFVIELDMILYFGGFLSSESWMTH
jgi:hypothetical protein